MGTEVDKSPRVQPEEIESVLERHQLWLDSKGQRGQRADLSKANLERESFKGVNLQNAYFQEAIVKGVDFQDADLSDSNFQAALVSDARFSQAKLQRADLKGAIGLQPRQLAGTDLCHAILPEGLLGPEPLGIIEEISKNARKLFFGMLLTCAYALLTIATTTDARLLTNSATSPLPIIGTQIPIVGFYWAAPLILLGFYLYFNIYLQTLWEALSKQPAVYPDGSKLYEKAYPWLLSSIICAHLKLLKPSRPCLSRSKALISTILAWWMVPGIFVLFWLRYIHRHDWVGTVFHVGILSISIGAAFMFQRLARRTLRSARTSAYAWKRALKDRRTYRRIGLTVGVVGLVAVLSVLSIGAIDAELFNQSPVLRNFRNFKVWGPKFFNVFGVSSVADFTDADVSVKPANWSGGEEAQVLETVRGAWLKGANLRGVVAAQAFLVNANLREADLRGAVLTQADLRGARFHQTKLAGASLNKAILRGAKMVDMDLQNMDLSDADLQGADLSGANLEKANLRGANLRHAILRQAHLDGADLTSADLSNAMLAGAGFQKAILRNVIFKHATMHGSFFDKLDNKSYPVSAYFAGADLVQTKFEGVNLEEIDLSSTNLGGADLRNANLDGADFSGAMIRETDFEGASLKGARLGGARMNDYVSFTSENPLDPPNLTIKQLCEVKSLDGALVGRDMAEKIKKHCPDLSKNLVTGSWKF